MKKLSRSKEFIVTPNGQWEFPGQNTLIPSNQITMKGVPYPVFGMDDTGYSQMMYPGTEYTFPGNMVYEIPMAQVGLQTGKENLPIYSRENYVKDIEANADKLFKNETYITPYKTITRPDEKNCINGICYLTRKLTNDALNIDYISNPDFKDDLNKNNFYTTDLEDGFEIGDILQYYTRKGSTFSGFPGKVTPANANDPWPQHAISIVGKRTDNNGKTFIKIVNNRGTDVAKVEEISELDLMKRAQEGYKHYDGILINRYDPEKVQELNRIKKENADIFSGKNKYAKEYDNAIYTGAYKPKDIYGKTLGEDASSIEFRKTINELYPTLGKSSNMPKENFDFLMNYLYGIGHQESNWGYSGKKAIKDAVPESLYPTLRDWTDSNKDDWRQDYWNKNVNNIKTKYKNIEEFKNAISEKKIDPEVSEYLRLNSPKSKGIFQQKEPSERGRYFNYGFDDTKSQIANAAALLIDNYHKVKKKFPNKPERELYQLAVLMHNSPSRALNPIYADYYPKNNDIDYFNKVEEKSAQPQLNSYRPLVKPQTITKSEKEKITKFLDQFKRTGGNVYSNSDTFNPETDEFIEFIDELPKAQFGIQKMYPDATSVNINLPQIDPKDKFIIQKNNSNIPKPTRSPFEELQYLDSQARSNYFDTISKLDSWPKLSGKTINLTTDRYRGAKVPIEYINMLTESANRFKIDPYLLYAIAGRESTFGQGSEESKERASTPINLISGWNLTESYEPYGPERFLADNKTPNITLSKDKTQYIYGIDYGENNNNLNTINEYITKNNLLDKYKTKLSKTKKINYTNPFDFLAEFIINKGVEKYNPGDPDYRNKINNEIRLLKMDPEFSKYVNQKAKGGLIKAQVGLEQLGGRQIMQPSTTATNIPNIVRVQRDPIERPDVYAEQARKYQSEIEAEKQRQLAYKNRSGILSGVKTSNPEAYAKEMAEKKVAWDNQPLDEKVNHYAYETAFGFIPEMIPFLNTGRKGYKVINPESNIIPRVNTPKQLPNFNNKSISPTNTLLGEPIGKAQDLRSINPNFKTWRDPDTGQIVYRLEKEDYRWDNDWEIIAPKDFREYVNYWLNHNKNKYRFSGGYSEMPKINRDINEFMSMAQFGKRPLLTRDRIALNDRELMNLENKYFNDPNFEYFDFRNDRIGDGMTYNGKDISQNRREFDIREAAKMAKNYTWAPWKNDVIAPEVELLNNKPFTSREAFQKINPNKYGGSIYKQGGMYNSDTDEFLGFID